MTNSDHQPLDPLLNPQGQATSQGHAAPQGDEGAGWIDGNYGLQDFQQTQGPVVGPAPRPVEYQPVPSMHDPMHPEFYDPYYDADEWVQLPRRSPLLLRLGLIFGCILLIGLVGYRFGKSWIDERVDPAGPPGTSIEVAIPSGATSDDIARILAEDSVVSSSLVTSYYWRLNDAPEFQAGTYIFRENMSVTEAQEILEGGPQPEVFSGAQVLIVEGLEVDDVEDRLLDEMPQFDPTELAFALTGGQVRSRYQPADTNNLEGLLFPAFYDVPEEELADELAMVQKMVNQFDIRADVVDLGNSQEAVGLTPYETVIVASLIEEEAKFDEERAKIARVIYNRLRDGELLRIDATVIYATGDRPEDGVVLNSSLEFDSPYNTYKYAGLPPAPISSPGQASLEAAMNPAEGDWKFYVVIDTEGNHAFAETFAEHEANIQTARANGVGAVG